MADMSQEELLGLLKTRNFEEGFEATPLKEFTGILTAFKPNMISNEKWDKSRLQIVYVSDQVEVIDTSSPYELPTAEIEMWFSTRKGSHAAIFGESIDRIINAGIPADADPSMVKGQDYLIGKRLHWKYTPGHMMWNGKRGEESGNEPRFAWEILAVEGHAGGQVPTGTPVNTVGTAPAPAGVTSARQQAMILLNGHTIQEFTTLVFQDATCKADGALTDKLLDGSFVKELIGAGLATVDENGTHTVPSVMG